MCLVIDTCCLASVFDPGNKQHSEFAPVLEWITPPNRGRMVLGGSKYMKELKSAVRYRPLIIELNKAGRTIRCDDGKVDEVAVSVKKQVSSPDFDDEHIVALVIVSRCRVVCTCDLRATPYLKCADLFRAYNVKRPKIYSSKRNENLCCNRNLIDLT
jgi:hypothetical protein